MRDRSLARRWARLGRRIGPGVITGAADDDPSGIATYSQAGAQFGTRLLWTNFFALPLMIAVQLASARLGRVTGCGLAANIRLHRSRRVLLWTVGLLFFANTINVMADIAAMGEALQLVVGGGEHGHALAFGALLLGLQIFAPYQRLVGTLRWLTLSLFAYVGVVLAVKVPWEQVLAGSLLPRFAFDSPTLLAIVAILGTTISPYMFFWQAAQEVEGQRETGRPSLLEDPTRAPGELRRTKLDTVAGMTFSNLIAFCIMLTAGVTLHPAGILDVQTSAQAALALRPLAGEGVFILFAAGIIGTGLLAVPVLAGSAAYAVAEALAWPEGLRLRVREARGFYAIVAVATIGGTLLDFTPIDPIKALFWAAVVNGVVAVPILFTLMRLVSDERVMGRFAASRRLRALGWLTTAIMAALALALLAELA